MEITSYFHSSFLLNTFIIQNDTTNQALLLDPVSIEVEMFELLEQLSLELCGVLLTTSTSQSWHAIRCLKRIYGELSVYSGNEDQDSHWVKELEHFEAAGITFQPIFIPGLHNDSILYYSNPVLFTGTLLTAGLIEKADESYGRALLSYCMEETLRSLPSSTIILPSQGPPSSVKSELMVNFDFLNREDEELSISTKLFSLD
jgi:hydroxyacylglutathione hydrolase